MQDKKILFSCKIQVPRHSSKKNEKVARLNYSKLFIGKSKKAKFTEDWILKKLHLERIKQRVDLITCDINARFIFYFPKTVYFTKNGERSRTIPDTSNLYELPADVLQKTRIIENDTQICSHDGSRRKPSDDNQYWLEIELTEV